MQDDVVVADSLERIQEDVVMTQAPALGKRTCDVAGDSGNKRIKNVEAMAEDPVQEDAVMAVGVNDDGDSSVLSTSSFDCRDLSAQMHAASHEERMERMDRMERDSSLGKRSRSDDDNDDNTSGGGGRGPKRVRGGSTAKAKAMTVIGQNKSQVKTYAALNDGKIAAATAADVDPTKKRGRGRPKGSKNKPKPPSQDAATALGIAATAATVDPTKKRGPGRPKGSKNKPKPPSQDAATCTADGKGNAARTIQSAIRARLLDSMTLPVSM